MNQEDNLQTIEVIKPPMPVYETWIEYFKRHPHLTDREKNTFIDSIVMLNTPILLYSPMNNFCQCTHNVKPGGMIPVDDVKKMICAKCHKPIRSLSV